MLPKRKLGELLVERGLVTVDQLQQALAEQENSGGRLGSIMVRMGFIDEQELLRFLSLYYDVPQVNLRETPIDREAVSLLSADKARQWNVLPFRLMERPPNDPILFIATPDPTDFDVIDQVRTATSYEVEPFVCTFGTFQDCFITIYGEHTRHETVDHLLNRAESLDLARAVAKLLLKKRIIKSSELIEALREEQENSKE